MSKILRIHALKSMVNYLSEDDYASANEILKIIGRTQEKNKRKNIVSSYIELKNKKEEKFFEKEHIVEE